MDKTRIEAMLDVEEHAYRKEQEAFKENSLRAELAIREQASLSDIKSGTILARLRPTCIERAKWVTSTRIRLRRDSLAKYPELGTPDQFARLETLISREIDAVFQSVQDSHVRLASSRGIAWLDPMHVADQREVEKLKETAAREVAVLEKEHQLTNLTQQQQAQSRRDDNNRKAVWVVHGRNTRARKAMFDLLIAIGLEPLEWEQAIAFTGKPTPYTGEVLEAGFKRAHAAIVLLTGDDLARCGTRYLQESDGLDERELTPQARPNVIFEAGMAFGVFPKSTVLVGFGKTRQFSDVFGRNIVDMNEAGARAKLRDRLEVAGCDVSPVNTGHWLDAGDFGAEESPDHPVDHSD